MPVSHVAFLDLAHLVTRSSSTGKPIVGVKHAPDRRKIRQRKRISKLWNSLKPLTQITDPLILCNMGFWLPQTIQKRLLLYVLQQISVLSNLDLSNLHVSLGSSSQFSFDDLNLAVDEINIPSLKVRSGTINHLEIELTVSGGVSICGKGVVFVIEPLAKEQSYDASSFSLARSIHDLTNSIMQFTESNSQALNPENDMESDASNSPTANSTSSIGNNVDDSEPVSTVGALENVKNKILSVALSKLMIRFEDVGCRFIFEDNHIIEAKVDKVELKTEENDSRKIELSNFKIVHIDRSKATNRETSSDDSMSNSVYYSPTEAASIYMSAMGSLQVDPDNLEDTCESFNDLVVFDNIMISFNGLSSIDDLTIRDLKARIRQTQIYFSNLFSLSEPLIGFILRGFPKKTNEKAPPASALRGYKRFQKEQNISEVFDNLSIDIETLFLHLDENMKLIISGVNYTCWENREQTLLINCFDLDGDGLSLKCTRSPIFRGVSKSNEINITILHSLLITIDKDALLPLFNILRHFEDFWGILQNNFPKRSVDRSSAEQTILFNSMPITLSLKMQDYELFLSTSKISSELPHKLIKASSLKIGKRSRFSSDVIISVDNFSIIKSKSRVQLNSYDENLKDAFITSKTILKIHEITLEDNYKLLEQIIRDFQKLRIILSRKDNKQKIDKQRIHLKKSLRILQSSSIIYQQTNQASIAVILNSVKIKIKSFLKEQFGNLQAIVSDIFLAATIDGNILAFCKNVLLTRNTSGFEQIFASPIQVEELDKPVVFLQQRSNGKIKAVIQNMSLHYYAKWLEFLMDIGRSTAEETKRVSKNSQEEMVWEVKLIDSSLILHPYRIRPSLVVAIEYLVCNGRNSQIRSTLKSGALLLIDDVANIRIADKLHHSSLMSFYARQGYSGIGKLDSVHIQVKKLAKTISLKIKANNIGFSLCSDSAHTLVQLCMDLKIPLTFSDSQKYSFNAPSTVNILDGIDSMFFSSSHIKEDLKVYSGNEEELVHVESSFIDAIKSDERSDNLKEHAINDSSSESTNSTIKLQEAYLDTSNPNDRSAFSEAGDLIDVKVEFEATKILIKLFDGFDWKFTRKFIASKIDEIDRELKNFDPSANPNERLETAVFDSIYISGNPMDAVDLKKRVNDEIQGEIESAISFKKADLHPSRHYKALIQLEELKFSFIGYSMGEITRLESEGSAKVLNRCDISLKAFEVIDNVPTSTWNKLLTILRHEQWPLDRPMLQMEICMVRPVDFLAATELILDINLAPLRLHVDQDTLDFLVKFGEFKDDRFELIDEYPDIPFIQKLTTNSVKLKLDYKPKKVDYSGLRSGHTSELMNFFILDGAKITLKGVALYGISGFSELNAILKSVWTPDITSKQLPGVLKGFAPVKSILALGSGVRALVSVPLSEYKQDQRLGRSLKQGCNVFVRTATGDFVKLGARLASGTQAILENTEEFLGGDGAQGRFIKSDEPLMDINGLLKEDQLVGGSNPKILGRKPAALVLDPSKSDEGEPKIVSLYADQPLDLHAGLEEAYSSLEKHMKLVYDVVWKTKGEIKESRSGTAAAAVSVAKVAPVAIIRPLIGATEAIAKALQGISNQIDKEQVNDINDKYKSRIRRN